MDAKIDEYIRKSDKWPEEIAALRMILLDCGLTEELKWGKPCFSTAGKNIVILQEMNAFLALMFFKGALLSDRENVLEDQGPNTRSARRIRFTSGADVARLATTVKTYVARPLVSRRREWMSVRQPSSSLSRNSRAGSTVTRRSELHSSH